MTHYPDAHPFSPNYAGKVAKQLAKEAAKRPPTPEPQRPLGVPTTVFRPMPKEQA